MAIDSIDDMRLLLADIPLDKVTTSMTINSTASILLLLYELVAEEQGVGGDQISGTIQNDLLKEYIARGTYVYPPRPSMRIITDIFEYCAKNIPKWNTISISGYHIREAGSTAVQEIAFTLANAIAYVQAAIDAGMDVDEFGPRLSFFWNGHNNFFEEVAKFRASRRMWYRIMTERFGAKDPSSRDAAIPHPDRRVDAHRAAAREQRRPRRAPGAGRGARRHAEPAHQRLRRGARRCRPRSAARLALRTQQIIADESGVVDTPDPLAGSYFVESLTDEVERLAWEYIDRIDEMGGAVAAIEAGFQMDEIEQAAYEYTKSIDDDERVIVGVNKYALDDEPEPEVFPIDPALERGQVERLAAFKADRDIAARRGRARRRRRRGAGHAEPAVPDEGGAAGQRHTRRGQRRAARGVRPLHTMSWLEPFSRGRELLRHDHRPAYGQRPRDRDLVRRDRWHAVPHLRHRPEGRLVSQHDRRAGGDGAHRRPDPRGTARVITDPDERVRVGDLMGTKYVWGGDPDIGLTYHAWCYEVPAVAIEF